MTRARDVKGARVGLLRAVEAPPSPVRTGTVVDVILTDVVPALRAKPFTWFLIAEFPARSSAGSAVTRLRKICPEVEWVARRPRHQAAGSHLYARHRGGRKDKP